MILEMKKLSLRVRFICLCSRKKGVCNAKLAALRDPNIPIRKWIGNIRNQLLLSYYHSLKKLQGNLSSQYTSTHTIKTGSWKLRQNFMVFLKAIGTITTKYKTFLRGTFSVGASCDILNEIENQNQTMKTPGYCEATFVGNSEEFDTVKKLQKFDSHLRTVLRQRKSSLWSLCLLGQLVECNNNRFDGYLFKPVSLKSRSTEKNCFWIASVI